MPPPLKKKTVFFRGGGVFTQATKVQPTLIFCNHFLPPLPRGFILNANRITRPKTGEQQVQECALN